MTSSDVLVAEATSYGPAAGPQGDPAALADELGAALLVDAPTCADRPPPPLGPRPGAGTSPPS